MGSIVGIACLRAEQRVLPQLTSHVFGLLKAQNLGNQSQEDAWLSSQEGTEWLLKSIDILVEAVESTTLPERDEVRSNL